MSLTFITSNGPAASLIWFPTGYRLNADDDLDILTNKLIPWIRVNFFDVCVVLQQDGAPAHTANKTQTFLKENADILQFWPKEFWPPYSLDANPS